MASAISQQVLGLATSTSPGLAQAGGYNILPAGIVFPFAGGTAPTGFLLCEGQEISKTTYAALYAAIGDDYAEQIDPTTGLAWAAPTEGNFRVPDYRGLFLRGTGTPSGLDAVARGALQVDKTKKNGLDASAVGSSVSGSVNISHTHGSSSVSCSKSTGRTGGTTGVWGGGKDIYAEYGVTNAYVGISIGGTASGQSLGTSSKSVDSGSASAQAITVGDGDNETRPLNKGVAYIIKA